MFLGSYDFDGDSRQLLEAFDRLLAQFPPSSILLNICVARDGGITVYDGCPTHAEFQSFSSSAEFAAAIAGAGLPIPKVTELGEVHHSVVRETVG